MTKDPMIEIARLTAALLLCFVFGSIHAYGVLLIPIEEWLSISRTHASLGYSLAIAALTIGVSFGAVLSRWLQPASITLICGSLAALGLSIFGIVGRPMTLLMGFGLLFGLGNGIAYGLSLQEAARSAPRATGWAIGLATAVYGSGSVVAALLLAVLLDNIVVQNVFVGMAVVIATACSAASLLFLQSPPVNIKVAPAVSLEFSQAGGIVTLWLIYLLGSMGGLMIITHSAAVIAALPFTSYSPTTAPMLVGMGSVAGGYLGGVLVGWRSPRFCLAAPLFGLTLALVGLLLPSDKLALFLLMVIGLCYGSLISTVPAVVRQSFGSDSFSTVFGLIFTAWGVAGLCGPLLGGWAYDLVGSYTISILAAAAQSAAAGILSLILFSNFGNRRIRKDHDRRGRP